MQRSHFWEKSWHEEHDKKQYKTSYDSHGIFGHDDPRLALLRAITLRLHRIYLTWHEELRIGDIFTVPSDVETTAS